MDGSATNVKGLGMRQALMPGFDGSLAELYADTPGGQPQICHLFSARPELRMGLLRAIADYSQAIRLNPHYGLAYGNRAFA